ncbi:hypothetical protein [Streptomyces sp. NPDC005930]
MKVNGQDSACPGAVGTGRTCAEGWELSGGTHGFVRLSCENVG